ncbi:MAG: hypothetical protein E6Q24_14835 [Chitinophagaceae bacterium]|nr:MAG: hypothetical protein E6Q24_14835 [Chitinophagaceae bacterium]
MKTFFLILLVSAASLTLGYFGGAYYYEANFHLMTSLHWDDFNKYSAQCEEIYGEPCGIYGGFAPKSKIQIQGIE